jgi:putative DNA primase/helicase
LNKIYFTNYAKLIFSANELPKTYDISPAFWNRWIILEFPYIFKSKKEIDSMPVSERLNVKERDESIIDKISTPEEMSGLLNWSLIGLDRLLKQKDFSYSKSVQEVRDFWIRKSDSFMAFCLDELEIDGDRFIEKKELRRIYNEYCKLHKIKSQGDKAIRNTLDIHFGVMDDRKIVCGESFHVWDGVRFKVDVNVKCESCQGYHGFSNRIGKNNSIGEFKYGGKPAEVNPPIPLFPVESVEKLNEQDLTNILIDKPEGMLIIDAINKGFLIEQINEWKASGLIFESPAGTIKLI